jgi:hypothetical protein
MGELRRRYGPQLPHDEAAQREHSPEVAKDLRRHQEADRVVRGRSTRPRREIGYLVVLIGVAGFIVSCFLPYLSLGGPRSMSLYQLVVRAGFSQTVMQIIGGFLQLFAGAGTVAWIALTGIRHRRHAHGWLPFALAAATAAWSLTWIGVLLSQSQIVGSEGLGYWSALLSLLVAIVGTVVVWVSARRTAHEAASAAGPEPQRGVPGG